jgi:hypothetical protein
MGGARAVRFANRRQATGFAFVLVGGLAALLLLSLPVLLSLESWPPWRDLTLDADASAAKATATGRLRPISAKTRGKERGPLSWMLEIRFVDGPHPGKTAYVYCEKEWGCPRAAGAEVEVAVSKADASLARLRGRRSTVLPWWLAGGLFALGVLSALLALLGIGLHVSGGRRARAGIPSRWRVAG